MRWEPLRALREHSQRSAVDPVPKERASRACGRRSGRNQVTRGSTCGVHLVHELLSAVADPPNYPGTAGSTAYSFRKGRFTCKGQRGKSLVTHPRHTDIACDCTVKNAAGTASSLAARAASDDAVHAALVLRREAAGCWCTHANGRGRNSVDDEATGAAWWRRSGVSWSGNARDLRQVTGLTGFVGTGNGYA
jgi:hypothetical protein